MAQSTPPPSAATPAEPAPAPFVELHAFLSASYTDEASTGRRPEQNGYRVFDVRHHKFGLGMIEMGIERPVSKPGDFGFRFDMQARARSGVSAASGLFRDPDTGKAEDVDFLKQAYASVSLPGGLRVDAGKFVTPLGLEVIEGWDCYNDNALAVVAVRLCHSVHPHRHPRKRHPREVVGAGDGYARMGQRPRQQRRQDVRGAGQVGVTPTPSLSVLFNVIDGPEQALNTTNRLRVFDIVATWKLDAQATLDVNVDEGREAARRRVAGSRCGGGAISTREARAHADVRSEPARRAIRRCAGRADWNARSD